MLYGVKITENPSDRNLTLEHLFIKHCFNNDVFLAAVWVDQLFFRISQAKIGCKFKSHFVERLCMKRTLSQFCFVCQEIQKINFGYKTIFLEGLPKDLFHPSFLLQDSRTGFGTFCYKLH
jgi:hypothetical protein